MKLHLNDRLVLLFYEISNKIKNYALALSYADDKPKLKKI